MKTYLKASHALVLASLLLLAASAACTTSAPTNTAQPSAPTNTTANANASPAANATPAATNASNAASAASLPVTLPVLDAMFADESFAGELKSKLQLSDEQVARLRQVAREETGNLSEEGDSGTTSAATRRAAEKIKEVVGEEKSAAFTTLVRERWSGGADALASKPNA